jgi:hypothetical protein
MIPKFQPGDEVEIVAAGAKLLAELPEQERYTVADAGPWTGSGQYGQWVSLVEDPRGRRICEVYFARVPASDDVEPSNYEANIGYDLEEVLEMDDAEAGAVSGDKNILLAFAGLLAIATLSLVFAVVMLNGYPKH